MGIISVVLFVFRAGRFTLAPSVFRAGSEALTHVIVRASVGTARVLCLVVVTVFHFALLLRVALEDIHVLSDDVHARDTLSILHSQLDEALVAPPVAPRVLDKPVG